MTQATDPLRSASPRRPSAGTTERDADYVRAMVDDRPEAGVFRVHRDVFRDPGLFELEMRYLFERNWAFLGLASQVARPFDYLSTRLGRQPVVVMRDKEGTLRAFINSCRHRGALLAHLEGGNKKFHACSYHGWVYNAAGKLVDLKGKDQGAYTPAFDAYGHDLAEIPRFSSYRGFLFGSLSHKVPALEDWLGGAARFIDLFVDQGPQGLEALPGRLAFTFDANWKTQIENATDSYHFTDTHASYIGVLGRQGGRAGASASAYAAIGQRSALKRGVFDFGHGHSAFWGEIPNPQARPLFLAREEVAARVGETRLKWMFYTRNMTVFPNLQLSENIAPQLRIIRPLSVDRTEMLTFCVGPKGEAAEPRRRRLRHYEEFFNPTGLATPDDVANYEDCQAGFRGEYIEWQQAYARGLAVLRHGPSEKAAELDFQPVSWLEGSMEMGDETAQQPAYREWQRQLLAGLASEAR
jgi:benzoate/toluate 1,2-dioxygenase alpha subunit/2,4,5-trichlorophenoxyacetic acid oxygenase 1